MPFHMLKKGSTSTMMGGGVYSHPHPDCPVPGEGAPRMLVSIQRGVGVPCRERSVIRGEGGSLLLKSFGAVWFPLNYMITELHLPPDLLAIFFGKLAL